MTLTSQSDAKSVLRTTLTSQSGGAVGLDMTLTSSSDFWGPTRAGSTGPTRPTGPTRKKTRIATPAMPAMPGAKEPQKAPKAQQSAGPQRPIKKPRRPSVQRGRNAKKQTRAARPESKTVARMGDGGVFASTEAERASAREHRSAAKASSAPTAVGFVTRGRWLGNRRGTAPRLSPM